MLAMLLAQHAQAEVKVRSTKDLSENRKVQIARSNANTIAAAVVVFTQCQLELGVSDERKEATVQRFNTTTEKYLKAYYDAYSERVGYPPDVQTVQQYTNAIKKEYQKTVAQTVAVLEDRAGCKGTMVSSIARYMDKLEKHEKTPLPDEEN